jgi:Tfp pilus assembly protein PilV
MPRSRPRGVWRSRHGTSREQAFTVIEITTSVLVLAVGCLTVAGVIIPMDRQRGTTEAKAQVIELVEKTFEQMRGLDPTAVDESYQGKTLPLVGIEGSRSSSDYLATSVDSINAGLLDVTVTASWDVAGVTETFSIQTKVYNP